MARSGLEHCPPALLQLGPTTSSPTCRSSGGTCRSARDCGTLPSRAGFSVFTVSGGTSLANWLACATVLDGAREGRGGHRRAADVRAAAAHPGGVRLPRAPARSRVLQSDGPSTSTGLPTLVTSRTRLAIVTNLHNPSGARIDRATPGRDGRAARASGRDAARGRGVSRVRVRRADRIVSARRPERDRHQQPDQGVRPRWPARRVDARARAADGARVADPRRARRTTAWPPASACSSRRSPGFRPSGRGPTSCSDPNFARLREYFAGETRLRVHMPEGGNVAFPRVPSAVNSDRLADLLARSLQHARRAGPVLRITAPHPSELRDARGPAGPGPSEPLARTG